MSLMGGEMAEGEKKNTAVYSRDTGTVTGTVNWERGSEAAFSFLSFLFFRLNNR